MKLWRCLPAGVDPLHVRKFVRDTFVAIDAGSGAGQQVACMDLGGALALARQIHCRCGVAVAAFQAVIGFQPRPFMLC